MNFLQICLSILAVYSLIAVIVFMVILLMEYVQQKQNEITRYHAKPTIISILRTVPFHLRDAFLWPADLTRYI